MQLDDERMVHGFEYVPFGHRLLLLFVGSNRIFIDDLKGVVFDSRRSNFSRCFFY